MNTYRMKNRAVAVAMASVLAGVANLSATAAEKPGAAAVMQRLKAGNERFVTGKLQHPNCDQARVALAARSNQADFALATLVSCSDSRVPVEFIFDTGIMDLFVVRIAGNVCDTDEIGSVEYGLAHVNTPVLVILGHSKCGAVTAVAAAALGHGHALERHIPPLVDNILPAVQKVKGAFPQITEENLVNRAIEENVWTGIDDILMRSAAVRNLANAGKVKILGALYDLDSGVVRWLSEEKVQTLIQKAEADPKRATEPMAAGAAGATHGTTPPAAAPPAAPAHTAPTPKEAPATHH